MIPRLPFLPEDLRQLLAFVPTHGWHAIDWRPLLRELTTISAQLATQRGVADLAEHCSGLTSGVFIDATIEEGDTLDTLSERERKAAGDALLRLYFAQWRSEKGFFLDLRPARLRWRNGELVLKPSGLYTQLDDGFRRGMIDLYRGFYRPDDALLESAMKDLGFLHSDVGKEERRQLTTLLREHFGSASTRQSFSIETFRASFNTLFEFFVDHNYHLAPAFVLVGFYLITLYLSLESLGQEHNVKALCLAELDREA